jgi:hypothetical protein
MIRNASSTGTDLPRLYVLRVKFRPQKNVNFHETNYYDIYRNRRWKISMGGCLAGLVSVHGFECRSGAE